MLQLISTQIPGQTSSSHLNGNLLPSTCLDPVSNQRSRGQSYRDAPSSLPAITLPFNELTTVELRGWIVLNKIKADRSSLRPTISRYRADFTPMGNDWRKIFHLSRRNFDAKSSDYMGYDFGLDLDGSRFYLISSCRTSCCNFDRFCARWNQVFETRRIRIESIRLLCYL